MSTQIYANKLAPRGHISVMEHAGFKARLMMADRLVGEGVHSLPPGRAVPVFPIAALPAAPDEWCRNAGTYVCPVAPDWGLWFDWTMNDQYNTAIVPSVKGMNPITGEKIDKINLKQYKDKCPIHGCDFSHERFCEECGYKCPPQNYIAYPNILWWDGFRQADGTVAQFFFSEDEARDVASAVIGKENTVPAFGFAFFKTKNQRIPDKQLPLRGIKCSPIGYGADSIPIVDCSGFMDEPDMINWSHKIEVSSTSSILKDTYNDIQVTAQHDLARDIKEVSVGAGAKIDQKLEVDVLEPDEWKDKPSAIIRLYFVFESQFRQILQEGGIKDLSGNAEGYLSGIDIEVG